MVYATDLKSVVERHVGSSPTPGTKMKLKGFEEAIRWDALRASHLMALKKPLSSVLVYLLYQARTYFQNK